MKRILFMVTKSENGGAQKWTKEQIEICSNEFKCFLSTDEDGWLSKNVKVENKYLDKEIHKRISLKYLLKLNSFVRKNKINLIVASSANAGIYSRLIKLFSGKVKVIYVSHGWSSIYNGGKLTFLYKFIEKQLVNLTDSILCISQADYRKGQNDIGISEKKLNLITNKIYPIKKIKEKIIFSDVVKILTVARLAPPKRVDLLIQAIEGIPNIELHIVGDGILKDSLESIANRNVFFHGEIDNFNDFSKYHIFALISDSEGLPLSALEAMSVGMPLILSNVGGCVELIDDNGCLVENISKEINSAIIKCIKNEVDYSKKSKKIFDIKFNIDVNSYEYLDYYNLILTTRIYNS